MTPMPTSAMAVDELVLLSQSAKLAIPAFYVDKKGM